MPFRPERGRRAAVQSPHEFIRQAARAAVERLESRQLFADVATVVGAPLATEGQSYSILLSDRGPANDPVTQWTVDFDGPTGSAAPVTGRTPPNQSRLPRPPPSSLPRPTQP